MVTSAGAALGLNRVSLTPDGERHPVMQLGATLDEARKEWSIVPPLGASTALGEAKPGASVLAITNGPGRTVAAARRRAALRPRPHDGVRGRGVVALAHDAAVEQQDV